MKELLLCIFLLHVVAAKYVAGGKLLELSYNQQRVYGKYASSDGVHGITFFSGVDDYLVIKDFSGKTIVETSAIVEKDGWKTRSVFIMGHEYLQHESPTHSDQPIDHDTPLHDALKNMLNVEEIRLMEGASEAVGQRGLTGKDTPAVMPFFLFALRMTQLLDNGHVLARNATRVERSNCENTCPPCPQNDCLGMCGKGCSCWKWVCGDCCWHIGCYHHDLCCGEKFFQTSCLFPFGFNCKQPYSC